MNPYLLVDSLLLEDKKKRKRKKPIFYYTRLGFQEKEYLQKWKDLLQREREEHDPKKKMEIHLMVLRTKNRLDQIRIQRKIKKNVKQLKSF